MLKFRFTIRRMMIAMTLLCVVVGGYFTKFRSHSNPDKTYGEYQTSGFLGDINVRWMKIAGNRADMLTADWSPCRYFGLSEIELSAKWDSWSKVRMPPGGIPVVSGITSTPRRIHIFQPYPTNSVLVDRLTAEEIDELKAKFPKFNSGDVLDSNTEGN